MKYEDLTSVATEPVERVVVPSGGIYRKFGKRVLDISLALLLLPVLLPVIGVLWLLVRRDGGPGFFAHTRVGQFGKEFQCFKIRSMVWDAEDRLAAYLDSNPAAAEEWAQTQKLADDPRVTRLGRFIRKTSLDELPQIWNVIKGEMSFVGPRPVTRVELERYGPHVATYLNLRPGITGEWQVNGRTNGCYDERLTMDRKYLKTQGLLRDLQLILATAIVVVKPTGR